MPFTESNYENAVIEVFRDTLGYTHIYGPDLERDFADPLYSDKLTESLRRVNSTFELNPKSWTLFRGNKCNEYLVMRNV